MEISLKSTFGNGTWAEHFSQTAAFKDDAEEVNYVVNLYPEITGDTLEGFGGAITESAGYVYSLMDEMQKRQLMEAYFSPKRMNYRLVRLHLDSCDFSLGQYDAVSDPSDTGLNSFSMDRMEKYVLPMLRDAEKTAGRKLELLLSPWSPPAYMKDNGKREDGGKLLPEYRQMWANYLCRYIVELRNRGFKVRRMTLQNEAMAVQRWDSCIFTAREQRDFIVEHMAPAMERYGVSDVEFYLWDHNKERVFDWMKDAIDPVSDPLIAGAAVHWYTGDHFEALELARRQFPDKRLISSESCLELYRVDRSQVIESAQRMARELIEDLNHGITAFYDWNILLDEQGGPNYVGNYCLAPFLYNTKTGWLESQLLQQYFEHITGSILPGSVRIAYTKYAGIIHVTAWKRPDGKLAIVVLNTSNDPAPVSLRMEGKTASFMLYPKSITSGLIS